MKEIALEMVYRAKENYEVRTIAGEHLLIPLSGSDFKPGTLLMLNETGLFLWEQMSRAVTFEALLAAARSEFEDPEGCMEESIREFLEKMSAHGLIETEGVEDNEDLGKT